MKISSIVATDVVGTLRFDSKFHLARDNPLLRQLRNGGYETVSVADVFGRSNVWTGNIFSRVYTTDTAYGKPLLAPYDLFRYVPWSDKVLSRSQVTQFDRLQIKRGWLFLVCSGRNLGPITIADRFCEQFVMSHDMVRISVEPSAELFYLAAFLSTAHGQALIRTDMNGSVIDHTDAKQVAALRYPLVDAELRNESASRFKAAFEKREEARLLLAATQTRFLEHFGLRESQFSLEPPVLERRYTINRSRLSDRIDAEPHAPLYKAWRDRIAAAGGTTLGSIADVAKPPGRYKTNYVDSVDFGLPMMNGRQVAQYRPIALKRMNLAGFKKPEQFQVASGMTLLTADGRAEENLADCALVAIDRQGWAASGHVHRVVPREGINAGLVYLACSCQPVQAQLKALATGSVVDALSEQDVSSVIVPYDDSEMLRRLGDDAQTAWQFFADATFLEQSAISILEAHFSGREASD